MATRMEIVTELPVSGVDARKPDLFTELDSAFSKLFTKSDDNTYLSEQVSESGELRIDDICKDPSILEITTDTDLIKRAIYKSKSLRVCSETTVKSATAKPEQNTLILRDIPSSTPSGDILQIFANAVYADGTPCPAVQSVRADMNDTWFVTFATESDAKTALTALRECKFQDKPVRARLKTESTVKSFYSAPGSAGSTSNKGSGSFSPHNRVPSAAPSPTAAAHVAYSPGPGPSAGQPQGAFFSAYPVPPPHPGAPASQGPPSAYANMIVGPDGKPAFATGPGQVLYAHPGQPPFTDSHLAGYNTQHPGGQAPYGNRRFNRGSNGFVNNQGYNNNRGGQGGYRHPGGRGQRPTYQYQQQHHHHHLPMAGYVQAMPPLAQMPPAAPQGTPGVPVPAQEAGAGDATPRSGAGSTTVDGSSPDDSGAAAWTGAGPAATGDQPAVDTGAIAADQGGPQPVGTSAQNPPPGHVGPYVSFPPSGPAPAYFPNFAFNGAPMPYPGFPHGGPAQLSPINFPGGPVPQGFFPLQMAPMHQMPQHIGFPSHHAHGYSPRQQQGHPGGEGGPRQQGHPRQHGGGSPRSSYNSYGQSVQPQSGPQQQHYQQQQQQVHGGGRGGAHRNGASAVQSSGPAATAPVPGEVDAVEGDPATLIATASTERKASAAGGQNKANRERKNSNSGAAADEKEHPARSARANGSASSETPATGEAATGANNSRRRLNSANSENTGRKTTGGGEASGGRKTGQKGEKGERSGDRGGEKKKGGKEKGRGDKGDQSATAAPVVKRAEFNLEADFPTLVDGDGADKTHAPAAFKPAVFDYANAARKASLPASATFVGEMASSPAPVAEATATTAKGGKKHTDRKGSESAEDVTAHLEAPAVQETVVSDAKQSTPQTESGSTPATTAPPAATAAAQSSLATAVSPSTASESAVESFTFGSVVAPVVTTTDKAAMQFGTAASATRGAAAALAVASAAETAAPPSSSSSTAATISAKPEAGNQHNTAGIRDDTPAHPLQPAAWPQAGASKPAAAADTGKTIAWGAKKSFADILQQSDRG